MEIFEEKINVVEKEKSIAKMTKNAIWTYKIFLKFNGNIWGEKINVVEKGKSYKCIINLNVPSPTVLNITKL